MNGFRHNSANKSLRVILFAALALLLTPVLTPAHAKLVRSNPADGEVLHQLPAALELFFNTALQNAAGMNSIVVTDQNGRRVDKNNIEVTADGKGLRVGLEKLASGVYSVEWRALSADDHSINGKLGFKVSLTETAAPLPENSPAAKSLTDEHAAMNHETDPQETGGTGWQSAVRWLAYLALMILFGGFAFRLLVFGPALAKVESLTEREQTEAVSKMRNRLLQLSWLNFALLAFTIAAALILQTAAVFNLGPAESLAPSRWFPVLSETAFGLPWLLQVVLLSGLMLIVLFIARPGKSSIAENPTLWPLGLGLCALLFLTPSLSGHARAAFSEYSLAILLDWLHLLAAGFWVGGLFHLALTMPKAVSSLDTARRAEVQARAVSNFTSLAVPAVIVIALTGTYNSWIHLDELADLWTTTYGTVLLTKTGLFLVMLALGGLNSFVLRPRLTENPDEQNFYRAVRAEALIGVVVLLLAAVLAFLPPARRHEKTTGNIEMPEVFSAGIGDGKLKIERL